MIEVSLQFLYLFGTVFFESSAIRQWHIFCPRTALITLYYVKQIRIEVWKYLCTKLWVEIFNQTIASCVEWFLSDAKTQLKQSTSMVS